MYFQFKMSVFQCHGSFQGCKFPYLFFGGYMVTNPSARGVSAPLSPHTIGDGAHDRGKDHLREVEDLKKINGCETGSRKIGGIGDVYIYIWNLEMSSILG